jgi:tetratricopeptide (TPR) repeat protein
VDGDAEEVTRLLAGAPPEAAADNRFWRFKGWLHGARGELDEAEAAFRKAISLNCYDYASRHQLANTLRRMRRADEAKALTELSREGREIRRVLYSLESVAKVPRNVLQRMAKYAKACGDDLVAEKLTLRLKTMFDTPVPEESGTGSEGRVSGVRIQGSGVGGDAVRVSPTPSAKIRSEK